MFSSLQSSSDPTSSASPAMAAITAGLSDSDDLALGWECADPALQIACWWQETIDCCDAGGA